MLKKFLNCTLIVVVSQRSQFCKKNSASTRRKTMPTLLKQIKLEQMRNMKEIWCTWNVKLQYHSQATPQKKLVQKNLRQFFLFCLGWFVVFGRNKRHLRNNAIVWLPSDDDLKLELGIGGVSISCFLSFFFSNFKLV